MKKLYSWGIGHGNMCNLKVQPLEKVIQEIREDMEGFVVEYNDVEEWIKKINAEIYGNEKYNKQEYINKEIARINVNSKYDNHVVIGDVPNYYGCFNRSYYVYEFEVEA